MSLVNLAHVCSHLQNASKARLGLTSIPVSKLHLAIALNMQKQGFLSSVTLGGPNPPLPTEYALEGIAVPSAEELQEEPWLAYPDPRITRQPPASVDLHRVPANPAQRRLWLGLKYWNSEPVLSNMKMVSKPSQRIRLNSQELGMIVRGRWAAYVKPMMRPGECMYVSTDRGVLEARECVERIIGGLVLCRVW